MSRALRGAAGSAAVGIGAGLLAMAFMHHPVQPASPAAIPAAVTPGPSLVPLRAAAPQAVVRHIAIPAAGIDTAVRPMPTSCAHVIDPPGYGGDFAAVYQCGDAPVPVVTGHTSKYADTVLNALDRARGRLRGTAVTVNGTERFVIVSVRLVPKGQLPRDRVWQTPARDLAIVTCEQASSANGPAADNLVVTMEPA